MRYCMRTWNHVSTSCPDSSRTKESKGKGHVTKYLAGIAELRNRHLLFLDVFFLLTMPFVSLVVRLEGVDRTLEYLFPLVIYTVVVAAVKLAVYFWTGLYAHYWRYASVEELAGLLRSAFFSVVAEVVVFWTILLPFFLPTGFPRSLALIDGAFSLLALGGLRLSIRLFYSFSRIERSNGVQSRALIVGAGVVGSGVVQELLTRRTMGIVPVGFVDDDPRKQGALIHGIRVKGTRKELPAMLRTMGVDQVIIAMSDTSGEIIRSVLQVCQDAHVKSKIVPSLIEILRNPTTDPNLRNIELSDLLRRDSIRMDTRNVVSLVRGARVMVTGGGGSIGSEICRQLMSFGPSEVVVLGHGENSIFNIIQELREHPRRNVTLHPVIADIRDEERMESVFQEYRPEVIFHAAAHKHVGLMETNLADAVSNNIRGTKNLVDLAVKHNVRRFIMISSDKAVNPTSVMGATKRVAELIVHDAASAHNRAFVTVRFGNVLGSRGSVVPIFERQIARGGPVTISHPDVRRFFMTIPEAVHLVLQAGTLGTGGELFVLDMGEQIRILDLAKDLIRLKGMELGKDISIVYTGLKAGEKMYEELFYPGAQVERTTHEKIMVCRNDFELGSENNKATHERSLSLKVNTLIVASRQGSMDVAQSLLRSMVPDYEVSKRQAV
jgi:FlaA1/EpsC-like NDP-sugar epimerase